MVVTGNDKELKTDLAKAFNLAEMRGALVSDLAPRSPAADAGLRQVT